jgi:hypothetical protein
LPSPRSLREYRSDDRTRSSRPRRTRCDAADDDLAGPLGAISTGVELLEGGDSEIVALIADAAAAAVASLRLHRFILAPPGDAAPAKPLLAAWLATRTAMTLDWQVETGTPAAVAMLVGLAMTAAEGSPDGGTLTVDDQGVTMMTAKVRIDPSIIAALAGVPVTIPRAALAGVIYATGGLVTVTTTADGVRFGYQGRPLPR